MGEGKHKGVGGVVGLGFESHGEGVGGLAELGHQQGVEVELSALRDGLFLFPEGGEGLATEAVDDEEGGQLLADAEAVVVPGGGYGDALVEGDEFVFLAEGVGLGGHLFHLMAEIDGEAFGFLGFGFLDDLGHVGVSGEAKGGEHEDQEDDLDGGG